MLWWQVVVVVGGCVGVWLQRGGRRKDRKGGVHAVKRNVIDKELLEGVLSYFMCLCVCVCVGGKDVQHFCVVSRLECCLFVEILGRRHHDYQPKMISRHKNISEYRYCLRCVRVCVCVCVLLTDRPQ